MRECFTAFLFDEVHCVLCERQGTPGHAHLRPRPCEQYRRRTAIGDAFAEATAHRAATARDNGNLADQSVVVVDFFISHLMLSFKGW